MVEKSTVVRSERPREVTFYFSGPFGGGNGWVGLVGLRIGVICKEFEEVNN